MKQFKWLPVSQMVQKKKPEKKRLFNGGGGEGDDNSRASLGMDEDSNMSNLSTASDSLDGPPSLSNIGDRWDTSRNFVALTLTALLSCHHKTLNTIELFRDRGRQETPSGGSEDKDNKDGGQKRTMVTAEGGIYKGDFSESGAREGRGEYIWPNGDR